MKNDYSIRVWADGNGHWFEIRDRRTILQTTWGAGSARSAREDADRVVENLKAARAVKAVA